MFTGSSVSQQLLRVRELSAIAFLLHTSIIAKNKNIILYYYIHTCSSLLITTQYTIQHIIHQYFSWRTAFKDELQFSQDDRRILTCQLAPHCETCRPAIGQHQESIVSVMGYFHTKLMPVVSHFNFSFFPPGRNWVDRLAVFTSLYYRSDCCFHGRGAYSTAEIGHTSDAWMSTLLMYGLDSFRWQLSCQGSAHQGQGIGPVPYQLEKFLWHSS